MSELTVLTHDEAKRSPKRIVLIEDHVSTNVKAVGKRLRSYLGRGELRAYDETLRRTALEPPAPGMTNCHDNTLALARDLWGLDHRGWHILIGSLGERGFHSWIEYGDAAVDTTYDKMILSVRGYHHAWSGIASEARGFVGPDGCDEYLSACRQLGIVEPHP